MFRQISFHKMLLGSCLLFLAIIFVNPGLAQENRQEQPQPSMMVILQINPGMGPGFVTFLKSDFVPALKKCGISDFSAWGTAFGEPGVYVLVIPIGSMADLDGPGPLVKGLGQKGTADLMEKFGRFVTVKRILMVSMRSDLGVAIKPDYVPKLGLQVTTTVAPGRNADYENMAKTLNAASEKANARGVYMAQTSIGGNPNEYRTLVLVDSFTDLERFAQAFSKALAGEYLMPMAGIVTNTEYTMFRYLPEVSLPAQIPLAGR